MDANKLENIISGYRINADDAAWLRALAHPAAAVLDAAGLDAAIHLAAIGDEAGASKALLAWADAAERKGGES